MPVCVAGMCRLETAYLFLPRGTMTRPDGLLLRCAHSDIVLGTTYKRKETVRYAYHLTVIASTNIPVRNEWLHVDGYCY